MNIFEIFGKIGIHNAEANKSIDDTNNKAAQAAKEMQKNFESVGSVFIKVGEKISSAGVKLTATATAGITGLATLGVKYNAQIEQYQTALTTLTGSSEKANQIIEQIKKDAAATPFDVAGLTQANQLMISTGLSAEDSRKVILALGDAVSATGGGNDELSRMAVNLQQIKNVGKATALDIKQFAFAGIDIYGMLSDYTGKTKQEVQEMDVTWELLNGALIKASQEGGKYFGAMQNQSTTLNGRISTLKDNFSNMLGVLTESLVPVVGKVLDKASDLIQKFSNLDEEQREQIVKWAGIVAALGPVLIVVGKVTSGIGGLFKIVGKLKGIGGLAGLVTKFSTFIPILGSVLGPIALVAAGIALLTHVLGGPKEALDKLKEAFSWCKDAIQKFLDKINFKDKIDAIKDKLGVLSEKLKGLSDLFKVIGTIIGVVLIPIIAQVMSFFSGLLNIIEPLIDYIGGIIDVLAGLGEIIVGIFTFDGEKILGGLKKAFGGAVEIIIGPFKIAWAYLEGFFEGISSFFSTLFEKLGITKFFEKVKSGFAMFLQDLADKFKNLCDKIKGIFEQIKSAIKLGIDFIVGIVTFAFQLITLPFRLIWEACRAIVETIWEKIGDKVVSKLNEIKEFISNIFTTIKDFISNTLNKIKDFFVSIWTSIYDFVSPIITSIKDFIVNTFESIKNFVVSIFEGIYNIIVMVWTTIVDFITPILEGIKNIIVSSFEAIRDFVLTIWEAIKEYIINPIVFAYEKVKEFITAIKDKVVGTFTSLADSVKEKFAKIKEFITKPMNEARDKVKEIVDKIKSIFTNFTAKMKMPHFKFSGSLNPVEWKEKGVPKISVDWYKKAMNFGRILDEPTIFGMDKSGQFLAGGEAGSETVVGTNSLMSMIRQNVYDVNNNLENKLDKLITLLEYYLPLLIKMNVCLDSGEIVGTLAPLLDKELGNISIKKGRGR